MKKIISMLLCISMVFAVAAMVTGCGSKDNKNTSSKSSDAASTASNDGKLTAEKRKAYNGDQRRVPAL